MFTTLGATPIALLFVQCGTTDSKTGLKDKNESEEYFRKITFPGLCNYNIIRCVKLRCRFFQRFYADHVCSTIPFTLIN